VSLTVTEITSTEELIRALGSAPAGSRALALVGGADAMPDAIRTQLDGLFETLVDYLDRTGTAVVDGGTDSGIMRLMGLTRAARRGSFRLIGVLPGKALQRRTSQGAEIRLAPEHPECLLVPGSRFGDESAWLFAAADHLAGGAAPTLVVNGGRLTHEEATARLAAGRTVVTVAGSGRAADALATDPGLRASGRLRVIPLTADAVTLSAALES